MKLKMVKFKDTLNKWLRESATNRRHFAQEGLILDASESILGQLERKGKKQIHLARMIGATKSHVSQLLNGSRNMTLRTLADMAFMLDVEIKLQVVDLPKNRRRKIK